MKKIILILASLLVVSSLMMESAFAQMQIIGSLGSTAGVYTGQLYQVGNIVAPQPNAPDVQALISTPSGQLSIQISQTDLPFGMSLAGIVGRTVQVVTANNQVTSFVVLPATKSTNIK